MKGYFIRHALYTHTIVVKIPARARFVLSTALYALSLLGKSLRAREVPVGAPDRFFSARFALF